MELTDLATLSQPSERAILLLVLDGLGGLPLEPGGPTELEVARTPNLDELARAGTCGLHRPVAAGVSPGSGPGHLALFGYDPLEYRTGRGVLSALGIGFDLEPLDIAARGNFCTLDGDGLVTDRRAGRISSEAAAPLAEALDAIEVEGAATFVRHVKEHRFLLVIRPDTELGANLADTDPGQTGLTPRDLHVTNSESEPAARIVRTWLTEAAAVLSGQPHANMALLRGFSRRPSWPTFGEVFGVNPVAIAAYPMYRGVARLVGMEAIEVSDDLGSLVAELAARRTSHDFFFLHYKAPDKAGEDGDFERKVETLEALDTILPRLLKVGPEVVLVTGDHSTPARLGSHSWHPVPFLIHGGEDRADGVTAFGETACLGGVHGIVRGCELMPLAAARAGRLAKFGA
jgi:2,3-bisphosphoglycerate-independent phosphoglycerate mutase